MKQAKSTKKSKFFSIGNVCLFTLHALERMAQYDFSLLDVYFPLAYGEKVYSRHGIYKCRLSLRNIPQDKWKQYSYLVGMTVILKPSSRLVITVYPDRKIHMKESRLLLH